MPTRIDLDAREEARIHILDEPLRSLVLDHLFATSDYEADSFSESPCFPLSPELQVLGLTCKVFRQEIRGRQLRNLTLDAGNFISLADGAISVKERRHIR